MRLIGYICRHCRVTLLAIVLLVVLWIRSYSASDHFILFLHRAMPQQLVSWQGQIRISISTCQLDPDWSWSATWRRERVNQNADGQLLEATYDDPVVLNSAQWRRFTFRRTVNTSATVESAEWTIAFPHWAMLILMTTPLVIGIRRGVRGIHRKDHGLCMHCGYDLRASPDRCPECGAAPPKIALV